MSVKENENIPVNLNIPNKHKKIMEVVDWQSGNQQ